MRVQAKSLTAVLALAVGPVVARGDGGGGGDHAARGDGGGEDAKKNAALADSYSASAAVGPPLRDGARRRRARNRARQRKLQRSGGGGGGGTARVVTNNNGKGYLKKEPAKSPAKADVAKKKLAARRLVQQKKEDRPPQQQTQDERRAQLRAASAPGCGPTPGTHHSPYVGCYADRQSSRAFPFELGGDRSRASRMGHSVLECERECTSRGFRYFGREFKGQCYCGHELDEIVAHGAEGGCDCCGGNVGAGKFCLWENANHPDSQADAPDIPAVLPKLQPSRELELSTVARPSGSHIASSASSFAGKLAQLSSSSAAASPSTPKPTGGFRLKMHWEVGYTWQDSRSEEHFCMQCRGSCQNGSVVEVDVCKDYTVRQKFIAIGRTIRPASNPSLCVTVEGYNGAHSPVKLRSCKRSSVGGGGGGSDQSFMEVRSSGKFELQPQSNLGRCLSQHHHPKPHEVVYPETCEKTRRFDTTYWVTH